MASRVGCTVEEDWMHARNALKWTPTAAQRNNRGMRPSFLVPALPGVAFAACALFAACSNAEANEGPLAAELPEPMVFDLVHGLGVESGAFEANVLSLFPIDDSTGRGIDWAPEIEYAVADGVAIEFELGFDDSELEAYKFATQFTFAESSYRQHGSQFIVEKANGADVWELTGLYLLGVELPNDWNSLSMFGLRSTTGDDADSSTEALVNVALFRELSDRLVFGVENDLAIESGEHWDLLVFPQLHYEISGFLSIQFGLGAEFSDEDTEFSTGFRLIYARPGGAPWR